MHQKSGISVHEPANAVHLPFAGITVLKKCLPLSGFAGL
ncbi:hypothetical protein AB434_2226 [Heyndrickxia coagulans]|uniref:Uncharacterized protein n=1 Tax=Heyndrickxia coagulans TaxID=1398 RepID=A0AAN0T965_HEYCO|nr:hypothetical protein SB48_HM08orf04930 [Heyndrickxia coagulans]AKN54631.1 hypothetical protein AB434_2226 [Heyndrickxia coagulans]KYC62870.1 hypothetical protein B4100_0374 [Heyndrickxia coagulans]KYC86341.1 hypothetical protein B4096_0411 [Heyndrickxia coagulans]